MSFTTGGMAACCDCGDSFYRAGDEGWKIRCVPCFIKRKNKESQSQPANDFWQRRAQTLEQQVQALECSLYQERRTIEVLIQKQNSQPALSSLDKELAEHLRALLQCCHPDKHGGSESANKTTQWLLDVKRRLPCA